MFGIAFLLAASASVAPTASADLQVAQRVERRAQPVVDRFYASVKRCGARPPFKPKISVSMRDGVIHYDQPTGTLVLYPWAVVEGEIKAFALARAAANGSKVEDVYASIFNELLVAHELAHWLQGFQPERRTADGTYDNWYAELNANAIMVAFWREHSASRHEADSRMQAYAGPETPNPVPPPAGTTLESFFTQDTMAIVRGGGYGWYQGVMTRRALQDPQQPAFCALVAEWLPLKD